MKLYYFKKENNWWRLYLKRKNRTPLCIYSLKYSGIEEGEKTIFRIWLKYQFPRLSKLIGVR